MRIIENTGGAPIPLEYIGGRHVMLYGTDYSVVEVALQTKARISLVEIVEAVGFTRTASRVCRQFAVIDDQIEEAFRTEFYGSNFEHERIIQEEMDA